MYLDYAELQAENHNAMTMNDWVEKLDAFLQFNGQEILHDSGRISHKVAQELAYKEYDKFKKKQDQLYISDFDRFVESTKLLGTKNSEKMNNKLDKYLNYTIDNQKYLSSDKEVIIWTINKIQQI